MITYFEYQKKKRFCIKYRFCMKMKNFRSLPIILKKTGYKTHIILKSVHLIGKVRNKYI